MPRGTPIRLILLGAFGAATIATAAAETSSMPQADAIALTACQLASAGGAPIAARCGHHEVLENRDAPRGRRIRLRVAVIPGTDSSPALEPIVLLAGGPGQSAIDLAGLITAGWIKATGRRVIAVDQRGTGGSGALGCPIPAPVANPQYFLRDLFHDRAGLARCRDSLARQADLTRYTSSDAADDLAEVLRALGVPRVILAGGSYGTRAGLVFIRRHPNLVHAAVLNGIVPPAMRNPLHHARGAQDAFDRLAADCASLPACRAAYPDLPGLLARVLARAGSDSFRTEVSIPAVGTTGHVVVGPETIAEGIRSQLYFMPGARQVPKILAAADRGDIRPLAEMMLNNNLGMRAQVPIGMLLSVVCGEDIPRIDRARIDAETRGTFLGATRIRNQLAVCEQWPRRPVPADFEAPIAAPVPVLLLSGSHDPATSPSWGDAALRILTNARHLVVPGAHNIGGPCVDQIRLAFSRRPDPKTLDASCVASMSLPAIALP